MSDAGDVLIVGAGPAGLLCAIALRQSGVRVTVIEAAAAISDAPRAVLYFPSTMLILQELGIFDDILARSVKGDSFGYHIPLLNERLQIKIEPVPGTSLDYNLHCGQDIVTNVALEHARRLGVNVLFEHRLEGITQTDDAVIAHISTPEGIKNFGAKWIVGADGARSTVRRLADITFDGITWPNRFIATNIYCDFEKLGFFPANFVCDPVHSAVIALIDKDGLWRLTYQEDVSYPAETFMERLPERLSHFIPEGIPYELKSASPYTHHQRAAAALRKGRVLLAGDAAHATNPCGGLGLTTGIMTAMVLSDILGAVVREEAGEEILDRYSDERRRIFWDVTSPAASQNKNVLERQTVEELRQDLVGFKAMAADPEIGGLMTLFSFRLMGDVLRPNSRWLDFDPSTRLGVNLGNVSHLTRSGDELDARAFWGHNTN